MLPLEVFINDIDINVSMGIMFGKSSGQFLKKLVTLRTVEVFECFMAF
jgi:hypothetical protein